MFSCAFSVPDRTIVKSDPKAALFYAYILCYVTLFCRFHYSSPLHKLLGGFSAMMVEEETMGGVELSNRLHVISIKFKVEEILILFHSLLMNGLRDDDYVVLQQPAQGYLCSSLAVFLANLGEGRVGEQTVLTFCQWRPRHELGAKLLHEFPGIVLLVEYMRLHLVHHRRNLHV